MKRLWLALAFVLCACGLSSAQDVLGCYSGLAGQGGQNVFVNGIQAAQMVVVTYPGATVNVYNHGTLTLATIFQDAAGTIPITQPWTSSLTDATAFWCAADGFYDVQYSNAGIATPFTVNDIHIAFNSGGGGGGGGIQTVTTASGSGLTNSITGTNLTLSMASAACPVGGTQIWNGTAWSCGSASAWSSLTPPVANLSLPLSNAGIAYSTIFTAGDYGLTPNPSGAIAITDNSVATTDTTPNLFVNTGNNSFHNPVMEVALTTGGSTFAQWSVCNDGASHLGFVAIGNSITCPNLSINPASKLWVMDNSNGHTQATLYMNGTGAVNPMLRFHTATLAASAPPYFVACPGATPNADGSCPSTNYVAQLLGNGTYQGLNFQNMLGTGIPLNGVLLTGAPTTPGQCPTSTSTSTATWQGCGSGGGGGGTGNQFQTAYYGAVNTLNAFGPGLTGQAAISQGASAAPVYASAGVGGSTQAGASYTVLCDSATTTRDRLTTIKLTNATPTITIPDPADSGCGSNFTFTLLAATGVSATVNRETAATFTTFTGSTSATVTTFNLAAGQVARFNSPDNTNYNVVIANGGAGGSPAWSSITNPTANLPLSMSGFTSTFTYSSGLANAMSWLNSVAATLGTPQSSPQHALGGQYWNGAASAADQWTMQDVIGAGTNGTSTLTLAQTGSSGAASVSLPNLIATTSTAHFVPIAEGSGPFAYITPSTPGKCLLSNGTSADPSFQNCPAGTTTFPVTVANGVSGGIPYFSSTTVESASAAGTINTLMKWGGAGAAPTSSSVTDAGTTVVFAEGLQFSGASGAATTISTASNGTLNLAPNGTGTVAFGNGTATNPMLTFAASASFGFYSASATNIGLGIGAAHDSHNFTTGGITRAISGGVFAFSSSSNDATTAADTGFSRSAADVVAFGNGTAGDTSARIKAAGFISVGTKFTSNSGCTEGTLVGGATAGTFVLGANSCSVVITMGNTATSPNGWSCFLNDQTTVVLSSALRQTSSNTTTATFAIGSTPQVSDVINFGCTGY